MFPVPDTGQELSEYLLREQMNQIYGSLYKPIVKKRQRLLLVLEAESITLCASWMRSFLWVVFDLGHPGEIWADEFCFVLWVGLSHACQNDVFKNIRISCQPLKNCKPLSTNLNFPASQKIGRAGCLRLLMPAWQPLAGGEVGWVG